MRIPLYEQLIQEIGFNLQRVTSARTVSYQWKETAHPLYRWAQFSIRNVDVKVDFDKVPVPKRSVWNVEFQTRINYGVWSFEDDPRGLSTSELFQLFNTVFAIIRDFVATETPDEISFSAEGKFRQHIYRQWVDKLSSSTDDVLSQYTGTYRTHINSAGESIESFRVKRKESLSK